MTVQQPGAAFTRGTVKVGEFELDYAEAGPADASVTLVSFPGSAGLEMSLAKDVLARNHRVVEINPPGWGGKDDLSRPMPMSEIGELLAGAADQLVGGPYFVIGTSMGGTNALYAAARLPRRIRGLILEGSMSPARLTDLHAPPPVPADPGKEPSAAEPDYPLPPFNPRKPWATEDFIRRQMANRFSMFRWVTPEFLPEAALQAVRESGIPVLALLGDQDEILKPTQAEAFSGYLPEADFRIVADGTHDVQNSNTEEFVALVEEFLSK